MSMTITKKSPGEVKELLASVGIDVRAKRWPAPGFVIIHGECYQPDDDPGALLIDGKPVFSAAWR